MPRNKYDWERIKFEFVHDTMTLTELARGVGCSYAAVKRRADKEGWEKERARYLQRVSADASETKRKQDVDILVSLRRSADDFAEVLQKVITMAQRVDRLAEDDGNDGEAFSRIARPLSDLARALKDASVFTRSIYDIPTDAEIEARELAKERLALERRKLDEALKENDTASEISVVICGVMTEEAKEYAE